MIRASSRRPQSLEEDCTSLQRESEGKLAADSLASSAGTVVRAASARALDRFDDEVNAPRRDSALDYSESTAYPGTPKQNEKKDDVAHPSGIQDRIDDPQTNSDLDRSEIPIYPGTPEENDKACDVDKS